MIYSLNEQTNLKYIDRQYCTIIDLKEKIYENTRKDWELVKKTISIRNKQEKIGIRMLK